MERLSFEKVVGNADMTQVRLMKERCIQVDEKDRVVGPVSKKYGELFSICRIYICLRFL